MRRTFIAPGKLMLAGEYSVLGAEGEALVVAVDPGVEAWVAPAKIWQIAWTEQQLSWREGQRVPAGLAFAQTALQQALSDLGRDAPLPHRIETRTAGATTRTGSKPGLGSSASTAAVVTAAVFGLAGRDVDRHREAVMATASRAHLLAQRGRGSGCDVAAVVHGVLVHFIRPAQVRQLRWPPGLRMLVGFCGQSARTSALLERLGDASQLGDELVELAVATRGLVDAFARGDLGGIFTGVSACHLALKAWDASRRLGVVTTVLERMVQLAERAGAAAKVSGAGGGDSVLALAADDVTLAEVARLWEQAGFSPLSLAIGAAGVREIDDPDISTLSCYSTEIE